MLAFSFVAFIQSVGGIMASYGGLNLKAEDAWSRIIITKDKKIKVK
jgi:cellulose synthase (UDP-forming)